MCLQVVSGVARSLPPAQVAQVAAACQGLPLLLKVVANALGSGRVTMRELQDALLPTPATDTGTAGLGPGGAGVVAGSSPSGDHQVLQTAGSR